MQITDETELPAGGTEALKDRYQVVAKLGEGGFSKVYRARQRSTGQDVAVKLLQLHQGDKAPPVEQQLARFQREAQLCAHLHHPHIVRLIDAGQAGETQLYSVFQFVPGDSLAQLLAREGCLPLPEAVRLMGQVLDALHCAHRLGIIHRDLKPSNIMVSTTGLRPNAQVLDFGISTVTGNHGLTQDLAQLTGTNELLGSPAYASPEQLRGEPVTVLSDFYTWGLILLEVLSGECPMRGGSLSEILYRQLGPEPVPIPESLLGHPLEGLLRRVLAKQTARRQVSAAGLLEELEALGRGGVPMAMVPLPARTETAADQATLYQSRQTSQDIVTSERRQITVLCYELQVAGGSEEAHLEEWDNLLRDQMTVCTDIVRRFGGQVVGVMGNRVLIYFGYPQARENDPVRAVRAALNLLEELQQRGVRQVDDTVLRVVARLGIHTGPVVVNRVVTHETPIIGTTASLAIRIAAQAEPGTILVSDDTNLLLDHRFIRESRSDAAGQALFRLYRELGEDELPQVTGQPAPFAMVGREEEMALLAQLWSQTRNSCGRGVLILGEAGIGKSRLTRALRDNLANEDCHWLECRCVQEQRNVALRPMAELLESLLRREPEADRLKALERLLERYGFDIPDSLPVLAGLLALPLGEGFQAPQLSPEQTRQVLFETLEGLILEIAQDRPTLLVIEDLHWVDPSTMELLGRLVEEAGEEPLLVLGTGRPEFSHNWPASKVMQLTLQRLSEPQTRELINRIVGGQPLGDGVITEIIRRTDGVSLFVEEMARMMLGSGWQSASSGQTTVNAQARTLQIPSTLLGLLTAKLDGAGPAKVIAQLAAALGEQFPEDLLAAISPLDDTQLQQALERLRGLDLIQRRRRRDRIWQFKHALVKDAAYDSMTRRTRLQVHRHIATVLEQQFPDLAGSRPELLLRHHAAADDQISALPYAQRAALGALQRSANAEAAEYAAQALAWLGRLDDRDARLETELNLLNVLAPALCILHGFSGPEVARVMARCQELLARLGDQENALPLYPLVFTYLHIRSQRGEALDLAKRHVAAAERHQREEHLIIALPWLAQCLWIEGDYVGALPVLERVLNLYQEDRHRHLVYLCAFDARVIGLVTLSQVQWATGQVELAWQQIDLALDYARQLEHPASIAHVQLYALLLHQQNQDVERVARLSQETLDYCQQHGVGLVQAYGAILHSWAAGQPDPCRQVLDRGLSMEHRLGTTYYRSLLAEVLLARGDSRQALTEVSACLNNARCWGEQYYLSPLYRLRGRLLLADGDRQGAWESFQQARDIAAGQQARLYQVQAALELARLSDDPIQGRALLAPVLEDFTGGPAATPLVEAFRFLQELEGR